MSFIRPPAVAGLFYPRGEQELSAEVQEYFDQAGSDSLSPGFPKLLIAPHAGFIYSGPIAAHAYDLLRPARGIVRRVVLLGPCHRVPVLGMALPGAFAFDTPLGRVAVDTAAVASLRGVPWVREIREAHEQEHGLEVQLPFLQEVLGEFSLVPFVVGEASAEQVSKVLELLWGGDETLIVISSDLSHYLSYEDARALDADTARAILSFNARITHHQACGATPIRGAMLAARSRGLVPRLLDLRNSADTAGGRSRVVGYGAFAYSGSNEAYGEQHGHALLALARSSIVAALGAAGVPLDCHDPWMREHRASFVTLKQHGRLRGCIGMLQATRPLGEDIRANARAAALQDMRFRPIAATELDHLRIEVSVLSRPVRLAFEDHAQLIERLVPGEDGVILEHNGPAGSSRSTFLPQVWQEVPDPEEFVQQLKLKAGLRADTRSTSCTFKRYRVRHWSEPGTDRA